MALFLFKRSRAEVRRATRARQAWERDAGREAHGMSENGPASRGISDTRETGAGRQCPLPFTERACRRRGDRSSAEERKRHVLLRYSVEASGPFFRKRHLRRAAMRGASFFLLPESPAARDAARKRDGCNRRSDGGGMASCVLAAFRPVREETERFSPGTADVAQKGSDEKEGTAAAAPLAASGSGPGFAQGKKASVPFFSPCRRELRSMGSAGTPPHSDGSVFVERFFRKRSSARTTPVAETFFVFFQRSFMRERAQDPGQGIVLRAAAKTFAAVLRRLSLRCGTRFRMAERAV